MWIVAQRVLKEAGRCNRGSRMERVRGRMDWGRYENVSCDAVRDMKWGCEKGKAYRLGVNCGSGLNKRGVFFVYFTTMFIAIIYDTMLRDSCSFEVVTIWLLSDETWQGAFWVTKRERAPQSTTSSAGKRLSIGVCSYQKPKESAGVVHNFYDFRHRITRKQGARSACSSDHRDSLL